MRVPTLVRDDPQTPGLDRRPEARALSVEDLMRDVLEGKLRVPPFQREIKWTARDALALLDSIYQGYPVGTLLLWQQAGAADNLHYGSVQIAAPDMSDAWWVVDGQQRIHSLTRVLAGKGIGADGFALHFDLAQQKFVRLTRRSQETTNHLPLTEVLDSERLLLWLRRRGTDAHESLAIRVGKRVREYLIPAYIVRTPDEDAVREIYRRVNSTGHIMKDSEVFDALHGARDGRRPGGLRGLSQALAGLGFGRIEEDLLLKMRRATLRQDVFAAGAPRMPREQSATLLIELERAARSAITLLKQDVGIPDRSVLPYDLPLIVLAAFFQCFPEIHPRSRVLLARWVWRGALTEAHRANTLNMRQALEAITPGDEHGSIQALLDGVKLMPQINLDTQPFALGWARCKLQILALLDLRPRHLVTGAPVELPDGIGTITRHIVGEVPDEWKQDLANIILHPALAGGLRRPLMKVEDPAILASHGISAAAQEQLRQGHADRFLKARADQLHAHIAAFVARNAAWQMSDRPPLATLEIGDD